MSALVDHTVLPPDAQHGSGLRELVAALADDPESEPSVVTAGGQSFTLSVELRDVLLHASRALDEGQAVTVEPRRVELSTQEVADLLGISRPTVVKLLESGEITYSQPGRHRRIRLEDALEYQQRVRHQRRSALAAMSQEAADDDAYGRFSEFPTTR